MWIPSLVSIFDTHLVLSPNTKLSGVSSSKAKVGPKLATLCRILPSSPYWWNIVGEKWRIVLQKRTTDRRLWMTLRRDNLSQHIKTCNTAKTIKILMEFEVKTFRENWEIFSPDIHTPSWNTTRYKTAPNFPWLRMILLKQVVWDRAKHSVGRHLRTAHIPKLLPTFIWFALTQRPASM